MNDKYPCEQKIEHDKKRDGTDDPNHNRVEEVECIKGLAHFTLCEEQVINFEVASEPIDYVGLVVVTNVGVELNM